MNEKPKDWRQHEGELRALRAVHNAILGAVAAGLTPVEIREWVEVSLQDAEFDKQMSKGEDASE